MSTYSWHKKHPDRANATHNRRRQRIRLAILDAYGDSKCILCGYNDVRALDLDHVDGGGTKHRKQLKGTYVQAMLHREGFPDKDKYRILCRNCNWIAYLEKVEEEKIPVTYSNKNYWPSSIILHAIELVNDGRQAGGIGAKEAFAIATEEHNKTAEVKFVLPASCKNSYASGILWQMKRRKINA